MRSRHLSLFDEIERDALKSDIPIADTLRKVMALGGQVGSTELREWASRELRGYSNSGVELPGYRKPGAVIKANAVNPRFQITGQQISPQAFPEGVREHIHEEVALGQGIGEIEAMARRAGEDGGSVRLTLPGAQDLARLMDHEIGEPYQNITALYWDLGQTAIEGVVDQVRTTLVELVAEMRATMPGSADRPTAAMADQAVHVAVHGDKARISVTAAQTVGEGHSVDAGPGEGRSRLWKVGALLVGAATVAAALIGLAQWQGWWGA